MRHQKPQSLSTLQWQNWNHSEFLFVIFVVIYIFNLASSSIIVPRNYNPDTIIVTTNSDHERNAVADNYVNDYTCYDVFGNAYLGETPHPSCCNFYIQCVQITGRPVPQLETCPPGKMFDMIQCKCVEPGEDLLCFDLTNPEHELMRFKCANPVVNSRRWSSHGKQLPLI